MSNTIGTVSILNVGAGDVVISFDSSNPAEKIRACRIIKDCIRRGYALLVEVERNGEKRFERARDFDEKACRYIIADLDPTKAQAADKEEEENSGQGEPIEATSSDAGARPSVKKGRRGGRSSVDAAGTRAVAVGRSAGG